MKKIAATLMIMSTTVLGCAYAAPPVKADEQQQCPRIEIVAARGTSEIGIGPQKYGSAVSNGFEGKVLSRLLHFIEQRYGPEIFDEVVITGIDDTVYRAEPRVPDTVGEPGPPNARKEAAWELIQKHGPIRTIVEPIARFMRSAFDGSVAVPAAMEMKAQDTGCRAQTIVLGYSQGAIVLQPYELQLAREGRLVGTLMIGDPQLKIGQVNFGQPEHNGGLFAGSSLEPQQLVPRFEYCKRKDFICDTSLDVAGGLDVHQSYFDPQVMRDADEEAVAELLAQWVREGQR